MSTLNETRLKRLDRLGRAAWDGTAARAQQRYGVPSLHSYDTIAQEAREVYRAMAQAVETELLVDLVDFLDRRLLHLRATAPNGAPEWEAYIKLTDGLAAHMGVPERGDTVTMSLLYSIHYDRMAKALERISALAAAGEIEQIADLVREVQQQAPRRSERHEAAAAV